MRITVALERPPSTTSDRDPVIGVTDEGKIHSFMLYDQMDYQKGLSPCHLLVEAHQKNTPVAGDSPVPFQYTMIFMPYYHYGACYTAQNGGYVNTGRFNFQLDESLPLSLAVKSNSAGEEYTFHYILVEVFNNESAY